jgi:hypothetical protein
MKVKPGTTLFLIILMALAILSRYAYKNGHYWLGATEDLILLFLFLWWIVDVYRGYKKNKKAWEALGNRIIQHKKIADILGEVRDMPARTLHSWHQWVVEHPATLRAREALIDICTMVIRAPSASNPDPNVREEAQRILAELAPSSPTPGRKTIEPVNELEGITCGSCGRRMTYKGKDAPVGNSIKGEYALYCQACAKYVCFPCVAVAMGTQEVNECLAKVMTGIGKCPYCGALSVSFEKQVCCPC